MPMFFSNAFPSVVVQGDSANLVTMRKVSDDNLGVALKSYHESASPATNDFVGYWNIYGKDSNGNDTVYGYFQALISDPTDTSEKGLMYVGAGGGSVLKVGQGIYTNNATIPGETNTVAAHYVVTNNRLVSALATPTSALRGARGFVTDSTATLAAGLGNIVAGGGANYTPVYCDGTDWRIG